MNLDHIKDILYKNDYVVRVTLHKEDKSIRLNIPKRIIEPICDAFYIEYKSGENNIYISFTGLENTIEIECPKYSKYVLILMDLKMSCDNINYHTPLLDFFDGDDIISDIDFIDKMKFGEEFSHEESQKEINLFKLSSKAYNNIIPFHSSFDEEAKNLDIVDGYELVKNIYFGRKA